jgi:hypothetical protein
MVSKVLRRDLWRCQAFNNLKTLSVSDWCVDADLQALVYVLRRSPLLQKLTLCLSEARIYSSLITLEFLVANQSVNMSLILHVRQELRVGVTKSTTQSRRNQTCRLTVNILRVSILDALGATKGCTLL